LEAHQPVPHRPSSRRLRSRLLRLRDLCRAAVTGVVGLFTLKAALTPQQLPSLSWPPRL
jgi:hypothetical protein